MDYLWSPWRYQYVKRARRDEGCPCCRIASASPDQDREYYVVHRAERNFIVLNLFPYTSGHVMVIPYEHLPSLERTPGETIGEMMLLTRRVEAALRKLYRPEGINIGMNVGKAAGAGVEEHIHMHALPRWIADSNFTTVIGETRVLPEELSETWRRLRAEFDGAEG